MLKARILLAIWFYLFNTSTYNLHIERVTVGKTEFSMNTEHFAQWWLHQKQQQSLNSLEH